MSDQVRRLESLLETAREDSDSVDPEAVLALLDAEEGYVRQMGYRTLAALAEDDTDRVIEHVDLAIAGLEDGFGPAETAAVRVLSLVGRESPEAIRPALPSLVDMLDQDPPITAYRAARALVPLLQSDPEGFVPHVDGLLAVLVDPTEVYAPTPEELRELPDHERERVTDLLEARQATIARDQSRVRGARELAGHALAEVADRDPEAVADRIDELPPVLSEAPPPVRAATIDAIAAVAEHDPDAAAPAVEALIEVVEDDVDQVRAHAVRALGHAGATEAVGPLRELAASDADPELCGLAADTADFLSDAA